MKIGPVEFSSLRWWLFMDIERSTLDRKLKRYKSAEQTETETKGE